MFHFKSYIDLGPKVKEFSQEEIKNEPMLFSCNYDGYKKYGGPITQAFVEALKPEAYHAKDLIIDSRVHMLKSGWYPAIPGYQPR